MLIYDKPFRTYDEQIEHLINSYGLNIIDRTFAKKALATMSYYDLINGYKECMMTQGRFTQGISIEFLYMFYLFDKEFQNILFKQSMFIENSFKTQLAYTLAEKIGIDIDTYLDPSNYFGGNKGKLCFADVKNNIEKVFSNPACIPQPTRHYIQNHNHLPPWILFKNISFSNAINLFLFLKPKYKYTLVNELVPANIPYPKKVAFLIASLNIIRKYRNEIAHNLKFVTYKCTQDNISATTARQIIPPSLLTWQDIKRERRGLNDIYSVIILTAYFLDDPYLIQKFFEEIKSHISPQDNTENELIKSTIFKDYATITNLPQDLDQRLSTFLNGAGQFPSRIHFKQPKKCKTK